jgi:uncharacterized protein (TIGR02646 family)
MIRMQFLPPNFECTVRETEADRDDVYLERADSEDAVRRKLESWGLTVLKVVPYDFPAWLAKARNETDKAIAARRGKAPYKFKQELWAALKSYLFRLSNGKCAYCEAHVEAVSWGDVEHFRPKSRVEEDTNHPGYYWLAYETNNLFPCCDRCNRARAKMNHFPVSGPRAMKPEDSLHDEEPLLLNPYLDDPSQHLTFVYDTNACVVRAEGLTEKGKTSIVLYHLNRVELQKLRHAAVVREIARAALAIGNHTLGAFMSELTSGKLEFSACVRSALYQEIAPLLGLKP